jgi:single-stranded DNA-binding protein
MDYCKVTLVGRAAKDTTFVLGNQDKKVDDRASISLAVNRPGKDAGCDFFYVVAWAGLATVLKNYSYKGKELLVEGSLRTFEKTVGDQKVTQVEVRAERIVLGADSSAHQGQREEKKQNVGLTQDQLAALVAAEVARRMGTKPETAPPPDFEYVYPEDNEIPFDAF